ncbi:hypothetical protein A2690_02540 [Candidatus Roizmanbacteria bacterium RIFCSPHIGHO2_01_FULL_39_12b]|uniref:Glycosyl transferase family 1 domain-containing protein n=1 Tax=Candidatus Roizmanbacteria bacterium RIFCSPHIGHO2_01_FULL_39_12b TaxID=1802030 RepID=A0A1F7GDU6_9BACT|nr:MAG: hypothetical protein A2690_02540 [Candidatus Roizmanbacteria bacterium RIFCSPHIGHO2_01_FULL_39_12b]OGK46624.1 MAG: hypothetical protein A3B46_00260 [Candidatus Roizmanbacteria bacterium RIFCSPLOWO2_01_FULL_39_19]
MNRIGIDCRLISWTGVGVYIQNLIRHLPEYIKDNELFFFTDSCNHELIKRLVKTDKIKIFHTNVKWHSLQEQTEFLKYINSFNLDLMHFPYFSHPILYRKPFVITIHDLTPLDFKTGVSTLNPLVYEIKYQGYKLVLRSAIKNSEGILVPSHAVSNQIVDRFGEAVKNKITVTYEGVDEGLINADPSKQLAKKYKMPFLVRLGNFYPHKNIERLIAAFAEIKTGTQLVLVGPEDFFSKKIQELAHAVENKNSINFHFNPTQSERVFFYKNALALVQPSLTEGFGLPIIEAQYFKCPIIASRIPVFQELLGEQYQYFFNPNNIDSIKETISSFLKIHSARKLQADNDISIIKKYSFKQMAQQTFKVYMNILNG